MDAPCPKYDEYYEAALNSDDIKKEEKENKVCLRLDSFRQSVSYHLNIIFLICTAQGNVIEYT